MRFYEFLGLIAFVEVAFYFFSGGNDDGYNGWGINEPFVIDVGNS